MNINVKYLHTIFLRASIACFFLIFSSSFSFVKSEKYKAKSGFGNGKLKLYSNHKFKQSYSSCTLSFTSTGIWRERNDTIYLEHLNVSDKSRITPKTLYRHSIFYRENEKQLTSIVYEINNGTIMFKIKYFK